MPSTRSARFWIALAAAIGLGCTALGLVVGAFVFGRGDGRTALARSSRESGAPTGDDAGQAGAADDAAAGATRASGDAGVARAVAARGSMKARVNRLEHPVVAAAQAPTSGEVERVHVKAGGAVTTGQRLYTLRDGKGARGVEAVVSAPAAGRIERRAARGDHVEKGDVLAQLVDPAVWLVTADLASDDPTISWSCQVSTAEGRNRAPCRLENVQLLGGENSRVTASVVAETAGWLQGGGQELLLVLSPSASSGAGEGRSPDPASTAPSPTRTATGSEPPGLSRPATAASGKAAADRAANPTGSAAAPDSARGSRSTVAASPTPAVPEPTPSMDAGPRE